MDTKAKYFLIICSAAFAAYLAFVLVPERREQSRRREAEIAESIERSLQSQREDIARDQLSSALAKCAADSLAPRAIKEFITHELMPLGIAWRLYEQGGMAKSETPKQAAVLPSEEYVKERLHEHFSSAMYSELATHEAQVSYKLHQWSKATREGLPTNLDPSTFTRYPPSFVFKSFGTSQFKNVSPESIELGKKEVTWSNFSALARRCKATPHDLRELSRDPAAPPESLPNQESVESVNVAAAHAALNQYSRMSRQFWKVFSETSAYKTALAEVKADNARIISEIIKVNEPFERQRRVEMEMKLKAADDVLFKTP